LDDSSDLDHSDEAVGDADDADDEVGSRGSATMSSARHRTMRHQQEQDVLDGDDDDERLEEDDQEEHEEGQGSRVGNRHVRKGIDLYCSGMSS